MISLDYFSIQKLAFAGLGLYLNPSDSKPSQNIIKNPLLLFAILLFSFFHFLLIVHFAYVNIKNFAELSDCMPRLCQFVLCFSKLAIFLNRRSEIFLLITEINKLNLKAQHHEMVIVQRANAKDKFICQNLFKIVSFTASLGALYAIICGLYIYLTKGEIVLMVPSKATYFWNHSHWTGYSLVYVLNVFSIYFAAGVTLSFGTLFCWLVSNIVAQFHIIGHRFHQLAGQHSQLVINISVQQFDANLMSCIEYHKQTLYLAKKLNGVFGEITFIKIIVLCSELCCLIFQAGRPNESLFKALYKSIFFSALALELLLYCWNGQRIKDESTHIGTAIYCAFDWSRLSKANINNLLLPMMRSQKYINITGLFFEVDLALFIWVSKTCLSLLTALKSLDEGQS